MDEIPSQWGRPLDQCLGDYGIVEARELFVWIDQIQRVKSDIAKVSNVTDGSDPHDITISTLKSILCLSYSPKDLYLLGSPLLFRGCIRLMASIKISGKTSSFSYELGYLCFRILTISLSVHLLKMGGTLDYTVRSMLAHPETGTLVTLSQCIARLVKKLIAHSAGSERDHYNCCFGWSTCHKHSLKKIVVRQADAQSLSSILYEDRHVFLKAMASTFSPGLSAVIYLIWRDTCYSRYIGEPLSTSLVIPFHELLWRYLLVATDDQYDTLYHIHTWNLGLWRKIKYGSLAATIEESRDLMHFFINRLSHAGSRLQPFPLEAIPGALHLLSIHAQPGCESLLPRVIAVTIGRIWHSLDNRPESHTAFTDTTRASFDYFGDLLEPLIPINSSTKKESMLQVIDELAEGNLLDLIGRGIFLLNPFPVYPEDSRTVKFEKTRDVNFLRASQDLCALLPRLVPRTVMDNIFVNLESVWWKVFRQLHFLEMQQLSVTGSGPRPRCSFYVLSQDVWKSIGGSLQSKLTKGLQTGCDFRRCPAGPVFALAHSCSRCDDATYCSARCQGMDWLYHHSHYKPHSESCLSPR